MNSKHWWARHRERSARNRQTSSQPSFPTLEGLPQSAGIFECYFLPGDGVSDEERTAVGSVCRRHVRSLQEDRQLGSGRIIKFTGRAASCLSSSYRATSLTACKSEYISLLECPKQVMFLMQVFGLMPPRNQGPEVTVFQNNESASWSVNNPRSSSRSKQAYISII